MATKTNAEQVYTHVTDVMTRRKTKKGYMFRPGEGAGVVIADCKQDARNDAIEALIGSGELVEVAHADADGGDRRAVRLPTQSRKLSFKEKAELEAQGIDPDQTPDERIGLPTETKTAGKPKAKRAPKEKGPGNPCLCGCGEVTSGPGSWFKQGHDARYAGFCKQVTAGKADKDVLERVFDRRATSHPKVRDSKHLGGLLAEAAKVAGRKLPKVAR